MYKMEGRYVKLIKKIFAIIVVLALSFNIFNVGNLKASAISNEEITAPSAILINADNSEVIFEKNPHEIRACASITKVMTLILIMQALENKEIKLDDIVTTSGHAASMGGSDIWLKEGETMTVNDMIKAITVVSANDAAVAMAELISGSEEEFVNKMNEKAKELGMNNTVFKNCNGLDEDGHVTSARDVATMSLELMKYPEIYNYTTVWMDNLRNGQTQLVNTNKLLKTYKGAKGLKTGTTNNAGSCISAVAQRGNITMLAVVLGSANSADRFSDASKLLDYGFSNYVSYTPSIPENIQNSIKVVGGMKDSVNTEFQIPQNLTVSKDDQKNIKPEVYIPEEIQAPVSKGQVVGKIVYKVNDKIIDEVQIKATQDINEINFNSIFKLMIDKILS